MDPSEKSTTLKLWESHGELRLKRRQTFSPLGRSHDIQVVGGKPIKFIYRDTNRIPIEDIIDHIIEKSKLFDVFAEEDNHEYRKLMD